MKKMRIQRIVTIDQKTSVDPDFFLVTFLAAAAGNYSICFKNEFLPESHKIQFFNVVFYILTKIVISVACAAEGVFFSLQMDKRYFASAVAFFFSASAGKRFAVPDLPVTQGFQIESFRH